MFHLSALVRHIDNIHLISTQFLREARLRSNIYIFHASAICASIDRKSVGIAYIIKKIATHLSSGNLFHHILN